MYKRQETKTERQIYNHTKSPYICIYIDIEKKKNIYIERYRRTFIYIDLKDHEVDFQTVVGRLVTDVSGLWRHFYII